MGHNLWGLVIRANRGSTFFFFSTVPPQFFVCTVDTHRSFLVRGNNPNEAPKQCVAVPWNISN